jgi:putative MATE family efflux protein
LDLIEEPTNRSESITARLFQLAWPISLEMLLSMSLIWIDSIVINHKLGTEPFTAVQLSGQISWFLNLILEIVATGAGIVIAHQIGAQEREAAGRTAAQALGLGFLIALGLVGAIQLSVPFLLALLGAKGAVLAQGIHFARIMSGATPAIWLVTGLAATMRATGDTRRPMYVTVFINILNAIFNLTLVVGLGWGITGSAVATLSAWSLGLVAMLLLFLRVRHLPLSLRNLFRFDRQTLFRIARMGVPGAMEGISYQASQFVLSMIVGPLGTVAIAARALAFQAEFFTYIPMVAMGQGASILVGQKMGAGEREGAVAVGRTAIRFGLLFTGALMLLLLLFPGAILHIFTSDADVLRLGSLVLRIMACYKLGQCTNTVCGGIFRGAGNPTWPTGLTTAGTWLITVPLAFVAVRLGWGVPGVAVAMLADELLRGGINLWYFQTPRWRNRTV